MHGHCAYMSAETYISCCDRQHSTLVQFVVMLNVNHSLAKARPAMRVASTYNVGQSANSELWVASWLQP